MAFPDKTDYARLKATLNNSKLQVTNNPLYQTILGLISSAENFGAFSQTTYSNPNSIGGTGDIINLINNLITVINAQTTGPASSVDGEIVLFDGTSGKKLKSATGTGLVQATAGVYSVITNSSLPLLSIASPTDAQIKTAPTINISLVPAPGVNKLIVPHRIVMTFNAGATAYGLISTTAFVWAELAPGGFYESTFLINIVGNDTYGNPLTEVTDFFGSTGDKITILTFPFQDDRGQVGDWGVLNGIDTLSTQINKPLLLRFNNGGVNLNGGAVGNVIKFYTEYSILSLV